MALARQTLPPEFAAGPPMGLSTMPVPNVTPRPRAVTRGAHQQYQRAQVESASPTRLIVMLYEGAIRFCRLAQEAMRQRDLEKQHLNLIRAQRIVGELLASLNRSAGGQLASNLSNIYAHILEELVKANLYDEPENLDHAVSLLCEMRASWAEIDRISSCDGPLVDDPSMVLDSPVPVPKQRAQPSARSTAIRSGNGDNAAISRLGDRRA